MFSIVRIITFASDSYWRCFMRDQYSMLSKWWRCISPAIKQADVQASLSCLPPGMKAADVKNVITSLSACHRQRNLKTSWTALIIICIRCMPKKDHQKHKIKKNKQKTATIRCLDELSEETYTQHESSRNIKERASWTLGIPTSWSWMVAGNPKLGSSFHLCWPLRPVFSLLPLLALLYLMLPSYAIWLLWCPTVLCFTLCFLFMLFSFHVIHYMSMCFLMVMLLRVPYGG